MLTEAYIILFKFSCDEQNMNVYRITECLKPFFSMCIFIYSKFNNKPCVLYTLYCHQKLLFEKFLTFYSSEFTLLISKYFDKILFNYELFELRNFVCLLILNFQLNNFFFVDLSFESLKNQNLILNKLN